MFNLASPIWPFLAVTDSVHEERDVKTQSPEVFIIFNQWKLWRPKGGVWNFLNRNATQISVWSHLYACTHFIHDANLSKLNSNFASTCAINVNQPFQNTFKSEPLQNSCIRVFIYLYFWVFFYMCRCQFMKKYFQLLPAYLRYVILWNGKVIVFV